MVSPLLVVGLGNLPYPLTRHSVGHLVLDALALRLGIRLSPDRHGYSGQGLVNIGETTVSLTLFKSKSLMNISGPSIAATYRKTVTNPKSLVVITDSLMHQSEKLSVKIGGSANGHNGMKSVIAALGGETEFYRFRIGIGRNDGDAAAYVLSKLSSHERRFWADEGLDLMLAELENVVRRNDLHQ
ncbi:Peptidyl-tRNA hydrolase [Amanita muscaria]